MLFLAPGKSFAAARAQQHDDTKVTQQQPSFEAVEIDQVDRLLEKQTGLITRPKDSNLYVFH
jgi:hypothetical protein